MREGTASSSPAEGGSIAVVGGWREVLTPEQQARFAAFADGLSRMGYEPARSTPVGAVGAGARG